MCKTNTGINSASMQYWSSLLCGNHFNGEIVSVLKNKTKQKFRNYKCQSLNSHLIFYSLKQVEVHAGGLFNVTPSALTYFLSSC